MKNRFKGLVMSSENMYYSNGHPAMCPFTRKQCRSDCQFVIQSKSSGLLLCKFGNGKLLQKESQVPHMFSKERLDRIRGEWNQ